MSSSDNGSAAFGRFPVPTDFNCFCFFFKISWTSWNSLSLLSLSVWCDTCGSVQRSPVFPLIPLRDEFKFSLDQDTDKFVCLQFGMFFYCIVAFLVGKVGGIIRCLTVFSMLSWFSWMSGLLSCWNAVKNLLCFNIIRLSTTQESRTFF